MTKDIQVYLGDIKDCIVQIEIYAGKMDQEEFFLNIGMQDAVARRLQIIGEASRQMSKDFKALHPEVPWRKISAMRNILIHEYAAVNLKRVWRVVQKDVRILKKQIEELLKQYPSLL